MPVVLVHQGPTLTQERYEEAVKRLSGGKRQMRSPADWPVPGLLIHAAGQGDSGFRVVDMWESEAAARRFGVGSRLRAGLWNPASRPSPVDRRWLSENLLKIERDRAFLGEGLGRESCGPPLCR